MQTTTPNLTINTEAIQAVNAGLDIPDVLTVEGEEAFKLEYHSTDAWRGYYEAVPIEDTGWEKLDDGWLTGDYDDAPAEARSSNVEERLNALAEQQDREGYDVVAVFAPTSNVFSTGYDVFRRRR